MNHFYHLVETNLVIDIGHVKVNDDGGSFSVERTMPFKGVLMLLTSEGVPVFEPNAFILNRRIVEGVKDIKPTCFHLLRYYRFLDANALKWDDHEDQLQRYPTQHLTFFNRLILFRFYVIR
ncbi:hypothetical protein ACQCN7_21645 [Escherichia coli]